MSIWGFLVPGALLTAGVLTAGLISFRQGNSNLGQKLMRARVVVQGATVALMVGSAYYYGEHFRGAKNQEN
ncbi:RING-H2 finger protein ATL48 [Rhynchospora pubera]|uniref:RING-H2 finger protein ATL48 n=1 Tax=Rhynchospora pubera TaxID=906938 RepID=A0AAV8BWM6_9POAL|nr:RING-H2 finger protein ATL48 [Rhynchospora pubera]